MGIHILVIEIFIKGSYLFLCKGTISLLQKEGAGLPPGSTDIYIIQPIAVYICNSQSRTFPGDHMGNQRLPVELYKIILTMSEINIQLICNLNRKRLFIFFRCRRHHDGIFITQYKSSINIQTLQTICISSWPTHLYHHELSYSTEAKVKKRLYRRLNTPDRVKFPDQKLLRILLPDRRPCTATIPLCSGPLQLHFQK